MAVEYDDITAFHYASYRPSLHKLILKRCLDDASFNSGLDIGCGTGQSAIALADFCDMVTGIDPSTEMISKAIIHSKVSYKFFDKNHISCEDSAFPIITMAGSLWYAKSQKLLDEIVRVGAENALVLAYDFEVLLEDILDKISFVGKGDSLSTYNHQEDFSGLNADKIVELKKGSERVSIQVDVNDLVHLILSVKEQYTFLRDLYGSHDLYDKIVRKLSATTDSAFFEIQGNIFFTLYQKN